MNLWAYSILLRVYGLWFFVSRFPSNIYCEKFWMKIHRRRVKNSSNILFHFNKCRSDKQDATRLSKYLVYSNIDSLCLTVDIMFEVNVSYSFYFWRVLSAKDDEFAHDIFTPFSSWLIKSLKALRCILNNLSFVPLSCKLKMMKWKLSFHFLATSKFDLLLGTKFLLFFF